MKAPPNDPVSPSSPPQRDEWVHLLVLAFAAFIPVLPLILNGCSCGHDFNFHLLNWMEVARQFTHGNLHPHWAFSPAYNAGEPRFVFYPPLSWTIGAILGLLMPWTWTPIVYTWLALTAAGLALYRLAREFVTPNPALLAAAFYLVNPYTLFTAYERTAYAELLAAAWIPLLLLAIFRKHVTIPRIAIPIALLWLTNDPAAVMGCYALALLTVIRLLLPGANSITRTQIATKVTTGTLLGLGLAAFYVLPADYERRYIQIATVLAPGTRVQNNFLFHHTLNPIHDAVLKTASIIAVVLLTLTTIALAAAATHSSPPKSRVPQKLIYSLTILTIAIAFLLTPLSNPIWQHVPDLPFLQFSWRLLAILAAAMSLAIGLALTSLKLKTLPTAALSLSVAAALTLTAFHLYHQYCYPEDTVSASLAVFRSNTGTDPSNEYTPTAASNTSLNQTNPPYWLIPSHSDINTNAPTGIPTGTAPTSLTLNSPMPQTLVLNLRDYPAWRITLNQVTRTTRLHRSDGLIAFPIPAGLDHITIVYAYTLDQIIGDLLTLISLPLLLLSLRHKTCPRP